MTQNLISNNKKNNLKSRVITAVLLGPLVILAILFLPSLSFGVVSAFLLLVAAIEWPRLMGRFTLFDTLAFICGLIFVMGIGLFLIQVTGHNGWVSLLLLLFGLLMWVAFCYLIFYYELHQILLLESSYSIALSGLLVLTFCWLGLNIIRNVIFGKFFVLYLLLLIWGVDTTAYFSGKKWGITKFVPHVSPKKTWAGVIGALIFSVVFSIVAALSFPISLLQRLSLIPLSVLVTGFSIIGDLTISVFKRHANLKDTSHLLPGHGGLLDRIDSLLAGAPIFALGLLILGLQQ